MKKIKNILAVALIALTGFISLVAMKPMREKFPEVGINPNPPVIENGCEGCEVLKIVNNSKCSKLKVVLGFIASQTNAAGTTVSSNVFPIDPIFFNAPNPNYTVTGLDVHPHVPSPIITSQTYSLTSGGIDIYASDYTTIIGNIVPGETNKRVAKKDANGNELTGLCDCYIVSWDTTTNTITISDC